jgi:hypothetical protein
MNKGRHMEPVGAATTASGATAIGPGSPLWRVAAHEAGHAIARLEFGWVFDSVYLYDPWGTGQIDGAVTYRAGAVWVDSRERLHENLVQVLAGYLAEGLDEEFQACGEFLAVDDRTVFDGLAAKDAWEIGIPYAPRTPVLPHWFSHILAFERAAPTGLPLPADYVRAVELATALSRDGGNVIEYLREAERQTEALVQARYDDLVTLAGSLVRRKARRMSYRQVCRLLRREPRTAQPPGVREMYD